MVLRILQNPVYIGTLEQGRVTTPSYKVKRVVHKAHDEWDIVENNHEAIIDRYDFEAIQRVLTMDTRVSASGKPVELFSGLVYCGECQGVMVRKINTYKDKQYIYYICLTHKKNRTCSPHRLRVDELEDIVLESLQAHIRNVIDLDRLLALTDIAQLQKANVRKLQNRLDKKQEEIERAKKLLRSLYENLADGIIDKDEYQDLKQTYSLRRQQAEEQAGYIQNEIDHALEGSPGNRSWIDQFRKYENITALDRSIIVTLVERVMIYKDHRVEVVFRWHNEYQMFVE